MLISKGAMFGLDARIALAIFGALSVISGAALYSTIKEARTMTLWQDSKELVKSVEQYFLDNYKRIPNHDSRELKIGDLLTNRESLSTWKGPYISGSFTADEENSLRYDIGGKSTVVQLDLRKANSNEYCVTGETDCFIWVEFHCSSGTSHVDICQPIFLELDKKFDNSDGLDSGLVSGKQSSANAHYYRIRGIPTIK